MESGFWHARWEEGRIGFHQPDINPYLTRYWPELDLAPAATVFVPLCGKSRDMLWLREQGHTVLGVEIVPQAVKAFFEENNLTAKVSQQGAFTCWRSDGITLLCGDVFDLTPADVAAVTGVYDRAALVALPPAMRQDYARLLQAILPTPQKILLVTMDYPQAEMQGPPYAVTPGEIEALFHLAFDIRQLGAEDILAAEPRFREQGLTCLWERVYLLRSV